MQTSIKSIFSTLFKRFQPAYTMFGTNDDLNFRIGQDYRFSPDNVIDTHNIVAIEAIVNTQQSVIINQSVVRDAPNYTMLSGGVLILRAANNTIIATIPLTSLTRPANNGKYFFTAITGHKWSNCSIRFMSNPGGINNNVGIKFNLFLS